MNIKATLTIFFLTFFLLSAKSQSALEIVSPSKDIHKTAKTEYKYWYKLNSDSLVFKKRRINKVELNIIHEKFNELAEITKNDTLGLAAFIKSIINKPFYYYSFEFRNSKFKIGKVNLYFDVNGILVDHNVTFYGY